MRLNRLQLDQFRTYAHLELEVPEFGLRISGRNASGKTSILEALVFLSTTRSPRASADRDVVRWESGTEFGVPPYARMGADLETRDGHRHVGITIELDPERQGSARKHYSMNGDTVRAHDMVGALKCVLFSPEDVLLVSGPPAERRRQIDVLISQIERTYLHALSQYGRVLSQRNQLLKQFARERRSFRDVASITEISFWDEELVSAGSLVMAFRHSIAKRMGVIVRERSDSLVDGGELGFAYHPKLELQDGFEGDSRKDAARIAAVFRARLEELRIEEFRRGMTLVGPHRDDFQFTIENRELGLFGSRGQQRLGVVAYRLAEIDIIDQISGERPILLLDDVLSELDATHRDMVMSEVAGCTCQILVTSTDASMLEQSTLSELPMVVVEDGGLREP